MELGLNKKYAAKFIDIDAAVSLQKSSIGIRAEFRVRYNAEFHCMRCLAASSRLYDATLNLDYVEGEDPYLKIDNVEITAHDADRVYYRGHQIDLSIGIREAIILSQPITHLCKDDCRGICPRCGINLNVKNCSCIAEKVGLFAPGKSSKGNKQVRKSQGNQPK